MILKVLLGSGEWTECGCDTCLFYAQRLAESGVHPINYLSYLESNLQTAYNGIQGGYGGEFKIDGKDRGAFIRQVQKAA